MARAFAPSCNVASNNFDWYPAVQSVIIDVVSSIIMISVINYVINWGCFAPHKGVWIEPQYLNSKIIRRGKR